MAYAPSLKTCISCKVEKPMTDFHKCGPGGQLRADCSDCRNAFCRQSRFKKLTLTPGEDSLYIMSCPKLAGMVKIGRSKNPKDRALQLQHGLPLTIQVEAEYEGFGFLELLLHHKLDHQRIVEDSASREWFSISVSQAQAIIEGTIVEYQLSCVQD